MGSDLPLGPPSKKSYCPIYKLITLLEVFFLYEDALNGPIDGRMN